jgi:molecular chaperone DnaJ
VEPDDFFSREGDDILCQVPISFPQAALGAEIEVPTLNGKKNITIPKGTEYGEIIRLKGEGFPKIRGYGSGDQMVQVIVKTPKNLTNRQEEIMREFEELSKKKDRGEEGREDSQSGWKKFFKAGN